MKKALVVVAHPDDETIWMGGKILREKEWDWTVLCLCRRDDADRKPKFFRVCELLNARGFISDLEDEHPQESLPGLDEVVRRVEPIVNDKEFDFVFTHGINGEYGHKRHIETHMAVMVMSKEGLLNAKEVFCFDYLGKNMPFRAEPNPKCKTLFRLSRSEHEMKRHLIRGVYGFSESSFEFLSCSPTEAFRKVS